MKLGGKVWKTKKDSLWLAEIPFLNLMVQAQTKDEVPEMVKDAIELLIDSSAFSVKVELLDNALLLQAEDSKKLIALGFKRQGHRD